MKANASNSPSPFSSKSLTAILLSEGNQDKAGQFLADNFQLTIDLKPDHAAAGTETLRIGDSSNLIILGLGKDPGAEAIRKAAHTAVEKSNDWKLNSLEVAFPGGSTKHWGKVFTEGVVLSNYQFLPYKSDKKVNSLSELRVIGSSQAEIEQGEKIARVTCIARDLVNEPVITLTAPELANRAEALGKEFGFSVEVLNKARIQSLKMGGLLAVNYGSPLPPTFTIMEWKPKGAKNEKPVILVGKGVVYDTGGLSLKPTANSMDFMKSDMGGAAAVIGAMCGVAALELPVHVIGLVPATDNRPGQNAYTPGDVIKMFDGSTVEVLNTDAEGRMILADALAYAKKYDPELVIDLATLTGAAVIAVGNIAIAMMATANETEKTKLKEAGNRSYERLVELPLWEEYGELLKSDIADVKNIGGRTAGSITAGKFLERFTDYPWIHLDIAGVAFLQSPDSYRGKNGTGAGVRLLLDFLANR